MNWLDQSVIYQIFIDRFYRGGRGARARRPAEEGKPVFCGGDLEGVTEKLDYICELGANAIWLSPFNRATAYHGYHITDYFRVEERFGGMRAFERLAREAGSRELRLIMDFVPNHVHREHPWFQKARAGKKGRYRGWFHWQGNGDHLTYLDYEELPKLNLEHGGARRKMIEAAKFWLDRGIDGFRLDHAMGPPLEFWRELRASVKSHRPDAVLIGEVAFWGIQRHHLNTLRLPNKHFHFLAQEEGFEVLRQTMREYADVFDGVLDFYFQKVMRLMAKGRGRDVAVRAQEMLDRHYAEFPAGCRLLSFLDNHDMDRFLFLAGNDRNRLRRAAEMQFKQAAPPVIYYGTEVGMSQKKAIGGNHGDLEARRMMPWRGQDRELFKIYQELIRDWKQTRQRER